MSLRFLALASISLLVSVAACSSDSASSSSQSTTGAGAATTTSTTATGDSGGTSSSNGGSAGEGGTGGGAPDCIDGPGYPSTTTPVQVVSASGTVVGLDGMPINGLDIQVCGKNLCLYGTTNTTGGVNVPVNKSLENPAFKWGDAISYPRLAIPFTDTMPAFPNLVNAPFPATGSAITAGASVQSGGVTVDVPAGAGVCIDELDFPNADQQTFRAVQIPADQEHDMLDPTGENFEMLFGVAPIETLFSAPVKVTVPNTPMWPAGTKVEFWVLGVDILEAWAPYGGWQKMSDGEVSADGMSVSTSDGAGFGALEVFAVRKAD